MPQWRLAIWTTPLSATPRSTASRKHDRHAARCCCSPSRSPIKYGRLEGSSRWNPRDLVDCRSRGDLPGVSLRHAIAYAGRMDEIQRAFLFEPAHGKSAYDVNFLPFPRHRTLLQLSKHGRTPYLGDSPKTFWFSSCYNCFAALCEPSAHQPLKEHNEGER
ncbi:hypothetical protein VTP01DRAFT_1781 [Rhizomucor pusillus]|uniref:uncharacterized protein n=1 Tax=Rhizomucor pusillus TaxID=4840 RepID=UPI0037441D26